MRMRKAKSAPPACKLPISEMYIQCEDIFSGKQRYIVFMVMLLKGYHRSFHKTPHPRFSQLLLNTSMAPQENNNIQVSFHLGYTDLWVCATNRLPLSRGHDPKVKLQFTNVNNKEVRSLLHAELLFFLLRHLSSKIGKSKERKVSFKNGT